MNSDQPAPWKGTPGTRRSRKRKKPLSPYKLAHPPMGFRIDLARRAEILRIRADTGLCLRDLVYDGVTRAERVYRTGYEAGFNNGAATEAARPLWIYVPCRVCGQQIPCNLKDPWFQQWLAGGCNGGHPGCVPSRA